MIQIGDVKLSSPVLQAPLEGISNHAYRMIAKEVGEVDFVWGERITVEGLIRKSENAWRCLDHRPEEGPIAYQISGGDPATLAEGARILEDQGAAICDLNMGCPSKKVIKNGAGTALMLDPPLLGRILRAMRNALQNIPLTIKIRLGMDDQSRNAVEICRVAESEGVAAVAVHGRTRAQGYRPPTNWEDIAACKAAVSIPVFGNGDVDGPSTAARRIRETGVDGILIGRAAEGNPWIFTEIRNHLQGRPWSPPSLAERYRVILRHFHLEMETNPRQGLFNMRKHIAWYLQGLENSHQVKDAVMRSRDERQVLDLLAEYFERRITDYEPDQTATPPVS